MQDFWKSETCRKMVLTSLAVTLALIVMGKKALEYSASATAAIREEFDVKVLELQSIERLLSNRSGYGDSNKQLEKLEKNITESRLVNAKTLSLAEARFQDMLDGLATKKGLNITSRKVLKTVETEDLKELHVAISARAEIGVINDFLNSLEVQEQAMFVESLEIKRVGEREERFYSFNAVIKAYSL